MLFHARLFREHRSRRYGQVGFYRVVRRRRLRDEPVRIDVLSVAVLYPANGRDRNFRLPGLLGLHAE